MTATARPPVGRRASIAAPLSQDVSDLMRSVLEVTGRLQATHDALQAKVADLQQELGVAHEQLRRSQSLAALGEMAAGIAHEVRNPLASILLDSELLQEDFSTRPDQAAVCARIRGAVVRLDTIVNDVLSFARETKVRQDRIDVTHLLQRAAISCEGVLRGSGIELIVLPSLSRAMILGDESLLIQALGNVLRNAIEAIVECDGEPRRITLSATRRRRRTAEGSNPPRVVLTVEDTGPGIAPDVVHRMFNPFFTTRRAGTGLGLAIVHRIVDAHGGEIDVTTAPAQGAAISIWLPCADVESPDDMRPATSRNHSSCPPRWIAAGGSIQNGASA